MSLHPSPPPFSTPIFTTYWLTCAAFTEGCQSDRCSPPEKKRGSNDSWKKSTHSQNSTLFFFFLLKRKHEIRARPSPSRNVGVSHALKQIGGRQAARIASTPSWTLLLFTGKPAFRARLVRNRDYTGNSIGKQRNETFFSSVDFFVRLWVVDLWQGVNHGKSYVVIISLR